jgi:hypothetical protein
MHSELQHLLAAIDQAYNRKSWHGTNLRGALRSVTPAQAAWRPAARRHNIHELIVHAAYWKYAAWRRLAGAKRGTFPLEGSNWFTRSGTGHAAGLRADIALLDRMHRQLREAIAGVPPRRLHRPLPGSALTPFALITGIAAHDLYHAGQIQLLKTLQK